MLGLRRTIGTILLVVVFLVLASLATLIYNSDQEKKEETNNGEWMEKGKDLWQSLFNASGNLADVNLQKNIGPAKIVAENVSQNSEVASFWSKFKTLVKEEWENTERDREQLKNIAQTEIVSEEIIPAEATTTTSTKTSSVEASVNEDETDQTNFVDYQKTDKGAEIIFTSKSGGEYKLPLPFKFLK